MALSVFEIGHADGNAGRIEPSTFVPPDGDFVLALGSEREDVVVRVDTLDLLQWEQAADLDVTKVLRIRARVRGPKNYPPHLRVGTLSDGVWSFVIELPNETPVTISYTVDQNGLPIAGQTGTAASITSFDGTLVTVTGLTGMTESSIGRQLDISGASAVPNNGKFVIRELVGPTSVKIENSAGSAPDANNGSISWTERRRDDDRVTTARGLVAAVNADPVEATAKHLHDGVFKVTPDDLDTDIFIDQLTVQPGFTQLNVATAPRWQFTFAVDGTSIISQEIDPRVERDLFDIGTHVLFVGAAPHEIRFGIAFNSLAPQWPSGGPFEVELPGVFIDALVFDEVT